MKTYQQLASAAMLLHRPIGATKKLRGCGDVRAESPRGTVRNARSPLATTTLIVASASDASSGKRRRRRDGVEPDRARRNGHRGSGARSPDTDHGHRPGLCARRGERHHL